MKAIIVEDEFLAQQELSWMIQQHSKIEIAACFDDGLDVLKYLQQHRVDVIFLDINIPLWMACYWQRVFISLFISP